MLQKKQKKNTPTHKSTYSLWSAQTCEWEQQGSWSKSIISYKMLLYSEQKRLWQIQFPPELKVIYMFRNHIEIERKQEGKKKKSKKKKKKF